MGAGVSVAAGLHTTGRLLSPAGTPLAAAACGTAMEQPRLRLQKTGPATARVGDTARYTLVVTNSGRVPARNVRGCHRCNFTI